MGTKFPVIGNSYRNFSEMERIENLVPMGEIFQQWSKRFSIHLIILK